MAQRKPVADDIVQVMVKLEEPPEETLSALDRGQKYQVMREHSAKSRDKLIAWIKKEGLAEDVKKVGRPSAFNLLFVKSTTAAASRLQEAPGVRKVLASGGRLKLDLPQPTKKQPYLETPHGSTSRRKTGHISSPRSRKP